MNANIKLFSTAIIGVSLMAGCSSEEDNLPVENITIVDAGNVKPAQKAESTQPTAILGSGGSMSGQFSQTFTNIVEPQKAKHVIVACGDLDTYKEEVLAAYQRGAIITIADPDAADNLDEWCDLNGIIFPGDPAGINRCSLVSFNKKASSITLQKREKVTDVTPPDEEEVPLVIFTGWLDNILAPNFHGTDFRSKDIKKRFAPQHVSHVFTIDLPLEEMEKSNWVLPEKASLSTTAEFKCDVYPLHSFAENAAFTGDLYVVEADLTIHNGNLYNGLWQYTKNNGAWLYKVCGLYLSDCEFGAKLLEKSNQGMSTSSMHRIAGGPAPASGTSSLQTGFEWNFDGWLTGGNGLESAVPTPMQEGGWTWNNQASADIAGLKVDTSSDNGNPTWILSIEGLPDKKNTAVPDIATGDLTFHCSWIWAVPQAVDNSTQRYYMNVGLNMNYMLNQTSEHENKFEKGLINMGDCSHSFMLIPPSRAEGQRI